LSGEEHALETSSDSQGVGFWIHVTPRARRTSVGGVFGGALRVAVNAAPVDGAANEACARALAEAFAVKRADIEIDPGARHRRKRVRVAGDPKDLAGRLAALAQRASDL
jgi:uncharacterized protein (TIGR00251 family)